LVPERADKGSNELSARGFGRHVRGVLAHRRRQRGDEGVADRVLAVAERARAEADHRGKKVEQLAGMLGARLRQQPDRCAGPAARVGHAPAVTGRESL
jgi:hypothetical protein